MKNFFIGTTVLGGAIILLIIIARVSGALQFYHGATSSMSPAIEPGEEFFSTNLVKAKRYDILIFKRKTDISDGVEDPGGTEIFTYRLIAMDGEKVEIKKGLAYVNDKLADDSTRLKFYYRFGTGKKTAILSALMLQENQLPEGDWITSDTNTIALLTYQQYSIAKKITSIEKWQDLPDLSLYQNSIAKNWTVSNYGPIFIAVGYYFLMGDNRNGARDSRFIGPVNTKHIAELLLAKSK